MMYPTIHTQSESKSPCGRPHISNSLARGILDNPPMIEDMIPVAAVREWRRKALVTYGFMARMTTS